MSGEVARRQLHQRVVLRLHVLACATASASAAVAAEAAERLRETLAELFAAEPSLVLQHRAGVLFLNGARVLPSPLTLAAVEGLGPRFFTARLDGVVIEHGVASEELLALAAALVSPGHQAPESEHVHGIPAEACEAVPSPPRGTYIKSIYVTKLLLEASPPAGILEPRAQKQLLQLLAETLLVHPRATAMLQDLEDRRGPTFAREVEVAAQAMLIGRAVGLTSGQLGELGLVALFRATLADVPDSPAGAVALNLPRAELYPLVVDVARRFVMAAVRGHDLALTELRAAAGGDGVQHALIQHLELALAAAVAR